MPARVAAKVCLVHPDKTLTHYVGRELGDCGGSAPSHAVTAVDVLRALLVWPQFVHLVGVAEFVPELSLIERTERGDVGLRGLLM